MLSVTHRLDAVVNYDLILVFDHDELVARGRHAELVVRKGLYAKLVQKQTGMRLGADGKAVLTPEKLRELPLRILVPSTLLAETAELFI